MKKTSLAKRNALISATNLSWGSAALLGVILLLVLRVSLPDIFWTLTAPAFRASDAVAAANHSFFTNFSDAKSLAEKNEILVRENASLAFENTILHKKISSLSALLGSSEKQVAQAPSIIAHVIARPPMSPYDSLVVAQGAHAGVTPGMEAFGAGGVPLGVVASVTSNTARIVLFSSSGVSTTGWVGKNNTAIVLNGAGAGVLTASLPRSADIVVGDTVFVPGPGLIPVGVVSRVDGDPSSPVVVLRILPTQNLFSVTDVLLRSTGSALFTSILTATTTRP